MNPTRAEGGRPAGDKPSSDGPNNKFDGAAPHHELAGESDVNFNAVAPIRFNPQHGQFAGWVSKPGID